MDGTFHLQNYAVAYSLLNKEVSVNHSSRLSASKAPGIYAAWISGIESLVGVGCYVGVTGCLKYRVNQHLVGNAEGSTLRRTLGCLLARESGHPLRRVGSGNRYTFTKNGEEWLTSWLRERTTIATHECDPTSHLENEVIEILQPGLNTQRRDTELSKYIEAVRRAAKFKADSLPIVKE